MILLSLWWISFGCGCCMTVSLSSRSKLKCSEVDRAMPIPRSEESDFTNLLLHFHVAYNISRHCDHKFSKFVGPETILWAQKEARRRDQGEQKTRSYYVGRPPCSCPDPGSAPGHRSAGPASGLRSPRRGSATRPRRLTRR